ncbi:hypothetical protein G3M48_009563 [Beauveria asiatica]|uniref:Uncharacterized protein n=1 Tax=Beauveria asiatica TaxID=1069075 RepID=A0AAW0S1Z4_9HYPO
MDVPIDTTPAAQILDRVVGHVVQSINDFNKIPSPQYRFTQRLTELTAQLERCTARLRQPRPQPQPGVGHTTEDEITDTTAASEGQQRAEASAISAAEASVPQLTEYGGAARNHSIGRRKVAFQIIDADNRLIAVLKQAGSWGNKRVDAILHMPIQRTVKLRREHSFDQRQLNAICDPSDKEGVKIVACMIQACGDIMHQSCLCCEIDKTGPFETCAMIDDEMFPQCGNCAWNRRLCRGALVAAEEEESPSSEARITPDIAESTESLNSSFSSIQSEDVDQRSLVSDNVIPGPISPGRQSQSDIASIATSSDDL